MSYHPSYEFTKEKWFADKEKRYEISQDIIDRKLLIGKTKDQVEQLLGREHYFNNNDHWEYYLGFAPGFIKIDPDVLDVYFKDGIVVKVDQHET